jgi:hypothetical protein
MSRPTFQPLEPPAMDFVYVSLTFFLFALSFGLVRLCERL